MPVNNESIIDPGTPKAGIPVKRATLGAIIMVICLLGLLWSIISAPSLEEEKPTAETRKSVRADAGNGSSIDDEIKLAQLALQQEERRQAEQENVKRAMAGQKPQQAQALPTPAPAAAPQPVPAAQQTTAVAAGAVTPSLESPIPPGYRRGNSDAALYEGAKRRAAATAPPPPPAVNAPTQEDLDAAKRKAELDASARTEIGRAHV